MKNKEIIKESLLFPIKNYKYFIIVTFLFLFSELLQEYLMHIKDSNISIIIAFILIVIIPLLVLGIGLQIIFHLLDKKMGAPKISFSESIKEALKDTILESYYFILSLLVTVILSIPTGLFSNLDDISIFMSNMITDTDGISVIEVMGSLPEMAILDAVNSIKICLIVFILSFVVFFSMCTISKIDLNINEDYKQSFNIIRMLKIIKKIGIIKYLEFLIFIIVISMVVANITFMLNFTPVVGSIISAFLESFSLFFFLHSFAKLYPK